MSNYPEGISGAGYCHMEGHLGRGNCPRCGDVNYGLLGYYGALARWGKEWGLTEAETAERFDENWVKAHPGPEEIVEATP